jgi:predicted DsbA family dithiol-disulfide isomerase
VAERSSLVRLLDEYEVTLSWVGYELHPETPAGGVALAAHVPHAEAMLGCVKNFAAGFGIVDLVPPPRLVPTRRILAVAQLAREVGRLDALRAVAFDAYWRRGWGLESDEDLGWIAREADLDPAAALAAASDPARLAAVAEARREAIAAGVTGIPTFDFFSAPGRPPLRVVGCQPYEVLADAAVRAGADRR